MIARRRLLTFPRFGRSACVVVAVLVSAGCDDGRPYRVPVSGQVLIDEKPLAYGYVQFVPENARPSGGTLNSFGRFSLSCFADGDGAVLGRHKIAVISCEPLRDNEVGWNTPKKYADYATSGLEEVIEGPTDSIVINLTWDGGAPFRESESGGD